MDDVDNSIAFPLVYLRRVPQKRQDELSGRLSGIREEPTTDGDQGMFYRMNFSQKHLVSLYVTPQAHTFQWQGYTNKQDFDADGLYRFGQMLLGTDPKQMTIRTFSGEGDDRTTKKFVAHEHDRAMAYNDLWESGSINMAHVEFSDRRYGRSPILYTGTFIEGMMHSRQSVRIPRSKNHSLETLHYIIGTNKENKLLVREGSEIDFPMTLDNMVEVSVTDFLERAA